MYIIMDEMIGDEVERGAYTYRDRGMTRTNNSKGNIRILGDRRVRRGIVRLTASHQPHPGNPGKKRGRRTPQRTGKAARDRLRLRRVAPGAGKVVASGHQTMTP